MSVKELVPWWLWSGRAIENARSASLDLAALRCEREEVAAFLTAALAAREVPDALVANG